MELLAEESIGFVVSGEERTRMLGLIKDWTYIGIILLNLRKSSAGLRHSPDSWRRMGHYPTAQPQ